MKEYIFRDPVHGDIRVDHAVILALINSPELQRLRRIRQLGAAFISYPGAEHTRFAHSLGTYYLMQRVLDHLHRRAAITLDQGDQILALAAALLHDVGHGPFSHLYERLTGTRHEDWTVRIITNPDTNVHRLLAKDHPARPEQLAGLLTGGWHGPAFLGDLLTSQLDVDRMDYLLRDSMMCGVPYGLYDLERLVACLTVYDGRLVVNQKGQSAAEAFILARYFMYWNVYFHKATRGIEVILERLLARARFCLEVGRRRVASGLAPALQAVLAGRTPSLEQYLDLDEVDMLHAIKQWRYVPDPVLADLAARFLNRRLLKGMPLAGPLSPGVIDAVHETVAKAGFNPPQSYVQVDETANAAYSYYLAPDGGGPMPIQVVAAEGGRQQLREISRLSAVVRGVAEERVVRYILFVPPEAAAAVETLLTASKQL